MRSSTKLRHILLIALLLWMSFMCQGCHIEIVECDYEYSFTESDSVEAVGEGGEKNATDYPELEIFRKNCKVVGSRHRRSPNDPLVNYFENCMTDEMPEMKVFMPTLVQFMMHHTTWYRRTENDYCKSDTVECWRSLCGYFLRWESSYIKPIKKCIEKYGKSKGRTYSIDKNVKPHISMPGDRTPQFLDSNIFLISLKQFLPENSEWDGMLWRELIRFYKEDFICSHNFCNCSGLPTQKDEKCGDNWLTRLVGSVDKTSKYREPCINAARVALNEAKRRQRWDALRKFILISFAVQSNQTAEYFYTT